MENGKDSGWLIDNIAETSKISRNIFLLYIGFLAYCILAIISTTDKKIILNDTTHLPIINIDISIYIFFIVAPILAIVIYIYMQLHIHWLKELKVAFQQKYPSETKNRFYPWILNFADDSDTDSITFLQKFIVNFSVWWLLPLVLILFPLGILRKHDPLLSYCVGFIPVLGTGIVLWFWYSYYSISFKKILINNPGKITLVTIMIIFFIFYLFFMIPWSFKGNDMGILNRLLYVDLSYQILINEQDEEYNTLSWGTLNKQHLERANLTGSILKKADMREVNLIRANMTSANLEGAWLNSANLEGANLRYSQLDLDKLNNANLKNSFLTGANLKYADLSGANLSGSDLIETKLKGATLRYAILYGADLEYACLDSVNMFNARLDSADLRGVNFFHARLDSANVFMAKFDDADLTEASFYGIKNLTIDQLSKAKSLYNVRNLDPTLMNLIKSQYPQLLEPRNIYRNKCE